MVARIEGPAPAGLAPPQPNDRAGTPPPSEDPKKTSDKEAAQKPPDVEGNPRGTRTDTTA